MHQGEKHLEEDGRGRKGRIRLPGRKKRSWSPPGGGERRVFTIRLRKRVFQKAWKEKEVDDS